MLFVPCLPVCSAVCFPYQNSFSQESGTVYVLFAVARFCGGLGGGGIRVAGDAGQAFATSDEPLLQVVDDDITLPLGIDGEPGVEDDKNKEDRREGERKIVVDAER